MRTYTVNEMMGLKPCSGYTKERVTKLWGDRKRLGLSEILDLRGVPAEDRLWGAIRCLGKREQAIFAGLVADRAVEKWALKCGIPEVETWAAAWLSGDDRSERAAWSARGAAWRAAESAARRAACSAACSAERQWQIKLLRKIAKGDLG